MRKVKWNPLFSGACMLLGGMLLWVGAARGDISSTNPAALLIFPKIVVDTSAGVDTLIQITNTADVPINVRCYLVNATPQSPPATTGSLLPPTAITTTTCIETDFTFLLTAKQPIMWKASAGLQFLPLSALMGPGGQRNAGSIPPAPQDPMVAELKCVEVGLAGDEYPIDSNDLIGQATIENINTPDIQTYNAYGVQSIAGQNNRDNTLVLGQEYNGCANYLILDHFFDNAPDTVGTGPVRTSLTLVPCSEDFVLQSWPRIVVQFLVYNEFEQRFSTSRTTGCFSELVLSDIDTRAGNTGANDNYSIFNFLVQGTLTGQTWIRGVQGTSSGNGLLAIAEEYHSDGAHFGAYVPIQKGTRSKNDTIKLVGASPAAP
ncbi:MAG: hypothetical protein H6Q33_3539 [Deltaproteobacteria bacterium]|nr:hypothetical protein [Deltaproteobacteria bacterium]